MSLLIPHHVCVPSLPLSLFFCLGLCVYRLVAKPCAHILRIQAGVPRRAQPNDVLERVYRFRTVHKAFACSIVPLKSCSTHWSTVVIALKYTTTAIMIPSVPTKMWRDSHTYMSCVFFFRQVITCLSSAVLLRVRTQSSWKDSQSSWTGKSGKYRGGFASAGTKTGLVCRKSSVRACRFLSKKCWSRWV